jgi:hypothetical protein
MTLNNNTTATTPTDNQFGQSSNAAIQRARDIRKHIRVKQEWIDAEKKELADLRAACVAGAKYRRVDDGTDNGGFDKTYAVLINGDIMGYVRSHYEGHVPIWFAYSALAFEEMRMVSATLGRADSRREATTYVIDSAL